MSHWVYEFRGADGELLYVGESHDLTRRLREHARDKWWFPDVVTVRAEQYADRSTAKSEERRRLAFERSAHNVELNHGSERTHPLDSYPGFDVAVHDDFRGSGEYFYNRHYLDQHGGQRCYWCAAPAQYDEYMRPMHLRRVMESLGLQIAIPEDCVVVHVSSCFPHQEFNVTFNERVRILKAASRTRGVGA